MSLISDFHVNNNIISSTINKIHPLYLPTTDQESVLVAGIKNEVPTQILKILFYNIGQVPRHNKLQAKKNRILK